MSYLEKDFQTDFNKWCKHVFYKTAVFELKITNGKSIRFDAVVEHQENALYAAKHGNVVFKIPDCGFQNPFDSFMAVQIPAYVVLMFHAKQKDFVMVDIDDWLREKQESTRKSLTEERAIEIGTLHTLA